MKSTELQKLADSLHELSKKAEAKMKTADGKQYNEYMLLNAELFAGFRVIRSASRGLAELESKGETL